MQDGGPEQLEALLGGGVYEALWRYCRTLAPTREDAEDLLQDCLAGALLALKQLRDPAAFKAWIFAIARRCYLDLRRSRAWRERAAARELGTDGTSAGASVDRLVQPAPDADPLLADLRAELAGLPAAQREPLELHYLHGLSLEEAARVLGISAANARQRVHRGREALRLRLGGRSAAAGSRGSAGLPEDER